jgi:hypothetical protein
VNGFSEIDNGYVAKAMFAFIKKGLHYSSRAIKLKMGVNKMFNYYS